MTPLNEMSDLTLAQLLRLYTALCLANNNWPNDPENIELLRIVNQAIMQKVGL